jgi:prophage antirepressor-like protein
MTGSMGFQTGDAKQIEDWVLGLPSLQTRAPAQRVMSADDSAQTEQTEMLFRQHFNIQKTLKRPP